VTRACHTTDMCHILLTYVQTGSSFLPTLARKDTVTQTFELISENESVLFANQMSVQQTTLRRLSNDLSMWKVNYLC